MNPDHPIDGDLTPSAEKTFSESDPERVVPKFWGFWGTVGWTLLALLAGFLVQTFTAIVVAVVRMRTEAGFKPESLVTDGLLLAIATLAQTPVVLGMIVLAIWIRRRRIVDTLALKRPSPRQAALWVGLLLTFLAASDLLTYARGKPIVPTQMIDVYRNTRYPAFLFIAVVFAAPMVEETVFRGFFQKGITESWAGPTCAIVLGSAGWSLLHVQYDWELIGHIFVMGVLLGLARWKSRSLPLTISMHAIANLIATAELVAHEWGRS